MLRPDQKEQRRVHWTRRIGGGMYEEEGDGGKEGEDLLRKGGVKRKKKAKLSAVAETAFP